MAMEGCSLTIRCWVKRQIYFCATESWVRGRTRTFARIAEVRPEYGIALIDLRNHGRSPVGDAPHTIRACANDRAPLSKIGYTQDCDWTLFWWKGSTGLCASSRSKAAGCWILLRTLDEKPEDQSEVIKVIAPRAVPMPLEKRKDLVDCLMVQGFSCDFQLDDHQLKRGQTDMNFDFLCP